MARKPYAEPHTRLGVYIPDRRIKEMKALAEARGLGPARATEIVREALDLLFASRKVRSELKDG